MKTAADSPPLSRSAWQAKAERQAKRAAVWTHPFRARRSAGELHPIDDFLFIYYRHKPSQLEQWHPGPDIGLEHAPLGEHFKPAHYGTVSGITRLKPDQMKAATRNRLTEALRLCCQVQSKPPAFGCFGLHEWAMVYRGDTEGEIRHAERLPLRLSQEATDAFVRSRPIQCSHFDAFRFFSPGARVFNRLRPDKEGRLDNEQCGCLHTNMDLYKFAAQSMPWIGSDLLWRCFEFAVKARQLDMQASPYDCTSLGFEPVRIETPAGRIEYERRQRALSAEAAPLRADLIERLQYLIGTPQTDRGILLT